MPIPQSTTLIGAMSTRMRSHLEISRGHPNVHLHAFYSPPAGEEVGDATIHYWKDRSWAR